MTGFETHATHRERREDGLQRLWLYHPILPGIIEET